MAINGSHRKGKNTATLLKIVLEEVAGNGVDTELVELADLNIKLCKSCNKCLRKAQCSISDDMGPLSEKLMAADGIVLGSPVYWSNVSTLMKNFMDRTRWMHMTVNLLTGKVGGTVACAGLPDNGQEKTLDIMEHYLRSQGMFVADCSDRSKGYIGMGVSASLCAGVNDEKIVWRKSVLEDKIAIMSCKMLGRNMVRLISELKK